MSQCFAENLSKIYNHVIEQEKYPTQLKIAKVIALYKKDESQIIIGQ